MCARLGQLAGFLRKQGFRVPEDLLGPADVALQRDAEAAGTLHDIAEIYGGQREDAGEIDMSQEVSEGGWKVEVVPEESEGTDSAPAEILTDHSCPHCFVEDARSGLDTQERGPAHRGLGQSTPSATSCCAPYTPMARTCRRRSRRATSATRTTPRHGARPRRLSRRRRLLRLAQRARSLSGGAPPGAKCPRLLQAAQSPPQCVARAFGRAVLV